MGWLINRRSKSAEATNLEAKAISANIDASLKLIPALTKRIDDLENRLSLVTSELIATKARLEQSDAFVEILRGGVAILSGQLREAEITPRWQVPAKKPGTGPLGGKA